MVNKPAPKNTLSSVIVTSRLTYFFDLIFLTFKARLHCAIATAISLKATNESCRVQWK